MGPIRVLLADDHALLREGLRALLASAQGIEVVAEVADGREAVPVFQLLAERFLSDTYAPETTARETGVPAATVRRIVNVAALLSVEVAQKQGLRAG